MSDERGGARVWRVLGMAAAVALCAMVLAACGDDDDGGGSSGAAASDTGSGGGGAEPTGEPIKTMTVASVNWNGPAYPNILATAKLYEQWVNDNGGIKGRPLQVITCDDMGDPNQTATCGRRALEEDVVAVVGSFTITGDRITPVLEQGGTAWFGMPLAATPNERNSPVSFEIGAGAGTGVGMAKQAAMNCDRIGNIVLDTPQKEYGIAITEGVLAEYGKKLVKSVAAPLAVQDYSPQVAQIIDGTDCILLGMGRSQIESFMPAFAQAGGDQRIFSSQGNLNAKLAAKFPEQTQDAITAGWYPDWSTPAFADYRAAIDEYDPEPQDWEGGGALGTWTGYVAFKEIVEDMTGPIDHDTFLEAANHATAVDTGGKTPVLDLSKEWTDGPPSLRREFNRSVAYSIVKDGKFQVLPPPTDDLTELMKKVVPE